MTHSKDPNFKRLKTDFGAGRISRRTFIQTALVMGVALPSALTMANQARAAEPKRGGTLRVGLSDPSTSDSLDPATYTTYHTEVGMFGAALNNLTELAPNGQIVPELAESYEASPDAKTWVFKLRKGVEFHNGKSLEAEDVIASFNHHRGEDSSSAAKSLLTDIIDIRADDKHTVVFELKSGNADFPYLTNDYHLSIFPSKEGKIQWREGTGTGGYVLDSFEPGVRMRLKRNPNYWKAGRAHFDEVMLMAVPDAAARQNALFTGAIDVMDRVDLKTAHLLARKSGIVLEEVTGSQHYTLPMNTTVTPFDNVDVRLALKLAIDRQALVDTVLRGHGSVANDHPIAPPNQFYASDLEQRVYDPDKAKFHLKKAGLSALSVSLSTAESAWAGAVDAAVLYQEQASKAGIDIKVVREPNDGYWSNVWMKKPWSMSYWGGRPTEDWMFVTAYAAGGDWNESFWRNDRFMQLLGAARSELDTEKRREMYREMQLLVRDDGGSVIPMYANYLFARTDKLARGPEISNIFELDGWKCAERWWFA